MWLEVLHWPFWKSSFWNHILKLLSLRNLSHLTWSSGRTEGNSVHSWKILPQLKACVGSLPFPLPSPPLLQGARPQAWYRLAFRVSHTSLLLVKPGRKTSPKEQGSVGLVTYLSRTVSVFIDWLHSGTSQCLIKDWSKIAGRAQFLPVYSSTHISNRHAHASWIKCFICSSGHLTLTVKMICRMKWIVAYFLCALHLL